MTDQTERDASIEASGLSRSDTAAEVAEVLSYTGEPDYSLPTWCRDCTELAHAVLASDWLAADRAAAESRGARRALREAVEAWSDLERTIELAEWEIADAEDKPFRFTSAERMRIAVCDWLTARAAAVTTSSAKSSDLATRVPQDESQHTGGGS